MGLLNLGAPCFDVGVFCCVSRGGCWCYFADVPTHSKRHLLLRGAIVIRTYGIHKNLYV